MKKIFKNFLINAYKKYNFKFYYIMYVLLAIIFIEACTVYYIMSEYHERNDDYTANNTVISMLRTLDLTVNDLYKKETDIFHFTNKVDKSTQHNFINVIYKEIPNSYVLKHNLITYKKLNILVKHLRDNNSLFISEKSDKNNQWVTVYTFYSPTKSLKSIIFIIILMHLITASILLLLIYIFKYIFPTELLKNAANLIKNKPHQEIILPGEIQKHVDDLSQRIQQLVHEKTIMLSSLSHDMKNMLTNLYLLSSMVSDDDISDQLSHQLDEIQMIIDSSLAFSEGENTKNKQKFNLTELLVNLDVELNDKGYDFECEILLPDSCYIHGYPSLLKRALINLANNARKYAGKFYINASLAENKIIISITDNGPGIDPSEIVKVVSPYYRSEKVLQSNIEGNGLGMAIASTAVKFHQGELEINNRESGGLEVIIKLHLPV